MLIVYLNEKIDIRSISSDVAISFRKRSGEEKPLGGYFAWGTFINSRRAAWWRAKLQVDDKKNNWLERRKLGAYTRAVVEVRVMIYGSLNVRPCAGVRCPGVRIPDRTFRWKLHQRTVKFCIPMWEALEYPSRRRRRLGKSISTEIGSSRRPGILHGVRQKLSFGRGRHFSLPLRYSSFRESSFHLSA